MSENGRGRARGPGSCETRSIGPNVDRAFRSFGPDPSSQGGATKGGFAVIAKTILVLMFMLPNQTCPTFEGVDPIPVGEPETNTATIPEGILPLNDILLMLGLPPLLRLENIQISESGGGATGTNSPVSAPSGVASYSLPYDDGTVIITLDWRRARLGLEVDVSASYSKSLAGLPLFEETWTGAFLVRSTTNYEATYSGILQHSSAENALPVEIVGRVSSAVLEDLSAGLSFQSTVSDGAIEFAVPFLLYSITSGGQTTAAQPGFQYCGGSCGCGARASDTGTISNPCAGLAKTPCSNGSSSCVVRDEDGNNVTRNCVWYAAGNPFVALYGISAALAAMSIRRRRCWSAMAEFFGSLR